MISGGVLLASILITGIPLDDVTVMVVDEAVVAVDVFDVIREQMLAGSGSIP